MNQQIKPTVKSTTSLVNPVDIVIYHANCIDGFASAWVVYQKYPSTQFIAASHGTKVSQSILTLKGKNILFVDFCYKLEVVKYLLVSNQISILDHHITTLESISKLLENNSISGEINLNFSGASLTWHHFFKDQPIPKLIKYIEDIDLWNLKYPETKAICLALNNYPMSFSIWDKLMADCTQLKKEGKIINHYVERILSDLQKHTHKMKIDEFIVPAVNAPSAYSSELGNRLAQKKPFAAVYYSKGDEYKISLRSTKDGEDVAKIAERFGGGGHREAASFKITNSQMNQDRVEIKKNN